MAQVRCKICPFLEACENNILSTDGTSMIVSIDESVCPVWQSTKATFFVTSGSLEKT